MSGDNQGQAAPPSAEQLRLRMLEKVLEEAEQRKKAAEDQQAKAAAEAERFLKGELSEDELAMIRRLVTNAASEGKMEALVFSFPSTTCSDSGRAINNADPDWPRTLQGKAKTVFDRYEQFAKPAGYRLKAMIINFPGGVPGDVGFFLSWAPETK